MGSNNGALDHLRLAEAATAATEWEVRSDEIREAEGAEGAGGGEGAGVRAGGLKEWIGIEMEGSFEQERDAGSHGVRRIDTL